MNVIEYEYTCFPRKKHVTNHFFDAVEYKYYHNRLILFNDRQTVQWCHHMSGTLSNFTDCLPRAASKDRFLTQAFENIYAFIKKSIYLCKTLWKMKLHVIWIQDGKTCLGNAISISSDRSSSDIPGIFLLYPDLLPVKTFMVCQTTVK